MPDVPHGWFLPRAQLLVLEAHDGLAVLGAAGHEVGRLRGSGAEALRSRLGGAEPSALLGLLARRAGLAGLLEGPAVALDPPELLRRDGWGLLFVELLARCNERCLHCYAGSGPGRGEALDWETLEAILREAADMGFGAVQLTGGEALLSPHVGAAARLGSELELDVEVYTNGVLLGERRYAELRAAGVRFAFSLYARDPAVHDRVTQLEGSHRLTCEAIARAVEGGSTVRVGVIATRAEDEPHALAAASLAEELGVPVHKIGIDVAREVGRGAFAGRPAPTRAGPPAEGFHGQQRGGKAAVLYDGRVAPCIFARDLTLGQVGPEGGLRAALESPRVRLRAQARDRTSEALRAGCAELTCGDCRVVNALLRSSELPQAVTP